MYTQIWSENLNIRELGRLRCRLVDNIKIDLRAVGCANVKLIHLACYFL
jgi:hypothetical protein